VSAAPDPAVALVRPCPHCADLCMAYDRLVSALAADHHRVFRLIARDGQSAKDVQIAWGTLRVHCTACDDRREVLTPLGERLLKLMPQGLKATEKGTAADDVPF
jgi:hypothetical protein